MVLPHVSDAQRRVRLGVRHRLAVAARTDDLATIADSVVAVHSTDPATVYLSLGARMTTPSLTAVSDGLHDTRSLVRHHGMRRTLWVGTPATVRTMHGACTVDIAATEWDRLAKWVTATGIEHPREWIAQLSDATLAAVHRLGPCSARQLGKAVPELTTKIQVGAGKFSLPQSAHTRLLLNLGFDGTLVRTAPTGSWVSSEYRWSVTTDWLPDGIAGADPTDARTALVAQYVREFGPVTTADVQWWTGWSVGPTRAALAACDAMEVSLDGGHTGWMLPDDVGAVHGLGAVNDDEPWVALLPSLDSTAMGWKQREWYLGEWAAFGGPLFDTNGNVGPTVWVNGEVVGGWAQRRDGRVVHELLRPVGPATRRAIDDAAQQTQALIGDARVSPRFPTPLQKALAAG
ncbi:MAG: winged helix DNA-binding domain-containing protein [Actinomycetota bacterium]|nr:winged helix DNA-binding domain-containing protein [Actinomycetota bacterium]